MQQIQYDGYELDYFDSSKNFRKYQLFLIKSFLKNNFLEVGAGKGGLTSMYKSYLKNITLLEPDIKLFKYLKKKFEKDKIVIKNYQIKDIKDTFDTIIYFDVLEHIKDDINEVKLASNRLNTNGIRTIKKFIIISGILILTFFKNLLILTTITAFIVIPKIITAQITTVANLSTNSFVLLCLSSCPNTADV